MTLLLVILALLVGFFLGVWCIICAIEEHHKAAWVALKWEIAANKRKRADAARDKEARP